jgi:hypothetical protein
MDQNTISHDIFKASTMKMCMALHHCTCLSIEGITNCAYPSPNDRYKCWKVHDEIALRVVGHGVIQ